MRRSLVLFALLAASLPAALNAASSAAAPARVVLDVAPSLLEIVERPGATFEREVTLTNGTDAPLAVSASVADWTLSESGEARFSAPASVSGSCAKWVAVEPASLVLPANGRAQTRISVRVPSDADGTHWAVVFFSLAGERGNDASGGSSRGRVGLTVYATAEGTEKESLRLTAASSHAIANGARLEALLENDGNTAVRFRLTWQLKSGDGKLVRAYEVRSVCLPGAKRRPVYELDEELPAGTYTVTAMARWGTRQWSVKDSDLVIGTAHR